MCPRKLHQGQAMNDEILIFKGEGGSMRPLIRSGELLSVIPSGTIGPGDCLAYALAGRTLVHRVWWKTSRGFWVNSDGGTTSLHFVPLSAARGKMRSSSTFASG